eukprot:gene3498-3956_t
MHIIFKTVSGNTTTMDIDADDKIQDVKRKIEGPVGLPVAEQRLVFAGKELDDGCTAGTHAGSITPGTVE